MNTADLGSVEAPATSTPQTIFLINSNTWVHDRLTERAKLDACYQLADSWRHADRILYPVPLWTDLEAPQRFLVTRFVLSPRLIQYSQADGPEVWAPGVFTALSRRTPAGVHAHAGPYLSPVHYEPVLVGELDYSPDDEPRLLWSFVGSVNTRPDLRGAICALHDSRARTRDTDTWNSRIRWGTSGAAADRRNEAMVSYFATLRDSRFVVCPRGVGVSSIRIFEAMRMGRVPIILADDWVAPPFPNWEAFSVRVAEADLDSIPDRCRQLEAQAASMGRLARAEWERLYSPERLLNTLLMTADLLPDKTRAPVTRLAMLARCAKSRQPYRLVMTKARRSVARS